MKDKMRSFSKRYPILFGVIVVVICMPLIWGIEYSWIETMDKGWGWTIKYGSSALIALVISYSIFRKSYLFTYSITFLKGIVTFGSLGIIGACGAFFFSGGKVDLTPNVGTFISYILMNFAIAISEELMFRGVILNNMLVAWKDKKNVVWMTILIGSTIFGLRHLLNLISKPDAVVLTITQVIFTFMAGCYLSAVYIRTKNLWICIVIHFLEDFSTSVWEIYSTQVANSVGMDISVGAAFGMIAIQIPYIIISILMIRDKRWRYGE